VSLAQRRKAAWFTAALRSHNYAALWNMARATPDFSQLLKRYLIGGGAYPYVVRLRTPVGPVEVVLFHPHDAITVTEVFCREDYKSPRELGVAVDIGANIGISALYFLSRNGHARCYCVEPDERNVEKLRINLAAFVDRYQLDDCAVSDASGMAEFGIEETGRYGGIGVQTSETILVRTRDINSVLEEVLAREDEIGVLKLDVEGLEKQTLTRIHSDFLERIRTIYFESPEPSPPFHPAYFIQSRRGQVERLVRRAPPDRPRV
jgi:FkbM family methyltransferase